MLRDLWKNKINVSSEGKDPCTVMWQLRVMSYITVHSACCIHLPDRFNQLCVTCVQLTVRFSLQAVACLLLCCLVRSVWLDLNSIALWHLALRLGWFWASCQVPKASFNEPFTVESLCTSWNWPVTFISQCLKISGVECAYHGGVAGGSVDWKTTAQKIQLILVPI